MAETKNATTAAKATGTSTTKAISSQWILLRGLARETRHWGDFPYRLQAAIAEATQGTRSKKGGEPMVRVDGLDLPGTGRYSEMRSPISIHEIAEFARAKLLEIRQRQRQSGETPATETHLVAVSLGGMVACDWIEHWPTDFASCTLINTSFRGFSPVLHRLAPQAYGHLFKIFRERDIVKRELNVLKMISNRPEIYLKTAEEWAKIQHNRPVHPENFARQLLAAARYTAPAQAPSVPVLVLNSRHDRMVNRSCSETIAQRWGAESRCHPTAGHDLPLDDPDWIVREITAFWLRQHARESAPLA